MSNQLQHKLLQFEAHPSEEVWSAIENRLNNQEYLLQERLLQFEAQPPANSWDNIEAALKVSPKETISLFRNKWFKYAVAAILLGIVSISIFTFAIKQPENTLAHQPSEQAAPNNSNTTEQVTTPVNTNAASTKEATENPVQQNKLAQQEAFSNSNTTAATERYKVVAKEDGKMVRLSQKALAVFDCAVKSTANKSIRCKENIENMQEKMATSIISPAGDFAGLIDMIKTLEENK